MLLLYEQGEDMKICDSYGDPFKNIEETAVWLGLINNVVREASKGNKNARAKIFSKRYEKSFQYICDLANVDMGYMRRKIKERFDREKLKRRELRKRDKLKVKKVFDTEGI